MTKTLLTIALWIFLAPLNTFAQSGFLSEEVDKCLSKGGLSEVRCANTPLCTAANEMKSTKVISCLENLGFKKSGCKFRLGSIECDENITRLLFPDSERLKLNIRWNDKLSSRPYLYRDKKSKDQFNYMGYGFETGVEVETAKRAKDGTWYLPKIGFPDGLAKLASPSETVFKAFYPYRTTAWPDEREGAGATDLLCTEERERWAKHFDYISEKDRKAIGFESLDRIQVERHFSGKNGPAKVSAVQRFSFTKDTKICGVIVPAETELWIHVDSDSCSAMLDGAVTLSGFPDGLFPKIRKKEKIGDLGVYCTPKAAEISNLYQIVRFRDGHKVRPLPKLDWQDCGCDMRVDNSAY